MKTLYEILQFACSGFWTFLGCFFIFSLIANAIGLTIVYSVRAISGKKCQCGKCIIQDKENIDLSKWSELPKPIECEKCGSEMTYADNVVLTSEPPRRRIICSNEDCKHISFKRV